MTWDGVEYIVRCTRLRDELKPVEIYPADTLEPIRPEWVAITHGVIWSNRRPDGIDGYHLYFLMDDGRCLALECFETLDITLDQAKAIAGIGKDEWQDCQSCRDKGSVGQEVAATEARAPSPFEPDTC